MDDDENVDEEKGFDLEDEDMPLVGIEDDDPYDPDDNFH